MIWFCLQQITRPSQEEKSDDKNEDDKSEKSEKKEDDEKKDEEEKDEKEDSRSVQLMVLSIFRVCKLSGFFLVGLGENMVNSRFYFYRHHFNT